MAESELVGRFRDLNLAKYPDAHDLDSPLDRSLWVLWVAKDELSTHFLTAQEISDVLVYALEISQGTESVAQSLRMAKDRVHVKKDEETRYSVMKAGKEHLFEKYGRGTRIHHVRPGTPFTSKIIVEELFSSFEGILKVN